jgi:hypothetical protein
VARRREWRFAEAAEEGAGRAGEPAAGEGEQKRSKVRALRMAGDADSGSAGSAAGVKV